VNKKPLISRLAKIYKEQQYTYFVTDGEGSCLAENMTEIDARIYAMKDSSWSIGRDTNPDLPFYNDDGVEISYENKDILSEEDLND